MRQAEDALVEWLDAGIDVARAGNHAFDIVNAPGAAMDRAGIDRGARCDVVLTDGGRKAHRFASIDPDAPGGFVVLAHAPA